MKDCFKCDNCGALLSNTNSVIVDIIRNNGDIGSIKSKYYCCRCWDHVRIFFAYLDHDENLKDDPLRNEKLRINYTPNKEAKS